MTFKTLKIHKLHFMPIIVGEEVKQFVPANSSVSLFVPANTVSFTMFHGKKTLIKKKQFKTFKTLKIPKLRISHGSVCYFRPLVHKGDNVVSKYLPI